MKARTFSRASVMGVAMLWALNAMAGDRSAVLVSSGTWNVGKVHATAPNSAPYNASGNERVEFRFHDWTPPPPGGPNLTIAIMHGCLEISVYSVTLLRVADTCDGNLSNDVRINLAGRSDIVVRVQRDVTNRRFFAEVWNGDRTNYDQRSNDMGVGSMVNNRVGSVEVAGELASGDLAWLRWYSTLLPLNSLAPSEQAGGDLGDWELENNLNDTSGRGRNLSGASLSYVPTPAYLPHCDAGASKTVAFGQGATLDASRSFALDGSLPVYAWAFVSGPSTPTISNASVFNPSIGNLQPTIAGEASYKFLLTISDGAGQTVSCTTKIGVVTTDASGIVMDSTAYSSILGPLTMWGTSPWPWYDVAQKGLGDELTDSVRQIPPSLNVAFEGTVTATADHPVKLVGTGTSFLSRLGSTVCVGTGTATAQTCTVTDAFTAGTQIAFQPSVAINGAFNLSVNGGPAVIVAPGNYSPSSYYPLVYSGTSFSKGSFGLLHLWWNPEGYPAGAGRARQSIDTIEDDTHLTLADYQLAMPLSLASNIQYGRMDLANDNFAVWGFGGLGGSNNWDYYDNVLAKYRLWMRTGIDDYLTDARKLADDWWIVGIDHGASPGAPRLTGLHGIMARALDGKPEMWTGIVRASTLQQNVVDPNLDTREAAYNLRYQSLISRFAPDPATRAQFCSSIANNIRTQWAIKQRPEGYWPQDIYTNNHDYPFRGNGTVPYMIGLALNGLRWTHEAVSSSCNDASTADLTLSVLMKGASFLKNYAQGSNRGLFYAVQYGSYATEPPQPGSGVATTVSGSTHIQLPSGSALSFFNCNGTDFIGVDSLSTVYKVTSCVSNTEIVVDVAPNTGSSGNYRRAVKMATNCAPSLATTCADYTQGTPADPAVGDRNIIGDVKSAFGYLFSVTGDLKYVNWGDDFMSADYGGSASGPGFPTTPCPGAGCAGPGADGNTGAYITALSPCSAKAPPCGGVGPIAGLGKYYGMADGAGDTPNYLAFRTGSALARRVYVDVPLAEVLAATQVRITVNQLSGTARYTCTASPCAIDTDGGLVTPKISLEYLGSSGQVLAKSVPELMLH